MLQKLLQGVAGGVKGGIAAGIAVAAHMAGIAVLFQIFQPLKHLQVRFHGHSLTALSAVGVQNTLDVAQTLASGHNAAIR